MHAPIRRGAILLAILFSGLSVVASAQAKPDDSLAWASTNEKAAQLYQECMQLLSSSFPAFQQAVRQQLSDGKPNVAVTNWLTLLQLTNAWPDNQKLTTAQYRQKNAEDMKQAEELMKQLKASDPVHKEKVP